MTNLVSHLISKAEVTEIKRSFEYLRNFTFFTNFTNSFICTDKKALYYICMRKRTDANQTQIVNLFRQLGFSVAITSNLGQGFPDLVCGLAGKNYLIEIKDGSKPKSAQALTDCEGLFHATWRGQVVIINSTQDVLDFYRNIHLLRNS
jgi:hypothetical protein